MEIHTDFTSGKHTLIFDYGKQVTLTKQESVEFELWHKAKLVKERSHEAVGGIESNDTGVLPVKPKKER